MLRCKGSFVTQISEESLLGSFMRLNSSSSANTSKAFACIPGSCFCRTARTAGRSRVRADSVLKLGDPQDSAAVRNIKGASLWLFLCANSSFGVLTPSRRLSSSFRLGRGEMQLSAEGRQLTGLSVPAQAEHSPCHEVLTTLQTRANQGETLPQRPHSSF